MKKKQSISEKAIGGKITAKDIKKASIKPMDNPKRKPHASSENKKYIPRMNRGTGFYKGTEDHSGTITPKRRVNPTGEKLAKFGKVASAAINIGRMANDIGGNLKGAKGDGSKVGAAASATTPVDIAKAAIATPKVKPTGSTPSVGATSNPGAKAKRFNETSNPLDTSTGQLIGDKLREKISSPVPVEIEQDHYTDRPRKLAGAKGASTANKLATAGSNLTKGLVGAQNRNQNLSDFDAANANKKTLGVPKFKKGGKVSRYKKK